MGFFEKFRIGSDASVSEILKPIPAFVGFSRGVPGAAGEQMLQAEMTNLEPEDEPVTVPD